MSEHVNRTSMADVQVFADTQVDSFAVLGERSSGTNYVNALLKQTLAIPQSDILGWKHGFPSMVAVSPALLVVCVFRNAFDWALSMHRKPWHANLGLQSLGFSEFLRAPWDTIVDRPHYFDLAPGVLEEGQVLQLDRHPVTGEMFENLMKLRAAKAAALLSLKARAAQVVLVQLEEVLASPERFVRLLRRQYRLKGENRFDVGDKRFGSNYRPLIKARPDTPTTISAGDRDFIVSQLDLAQEARLGFAYSRPGIEWLYRPDSAA